MRVAERAVVVPGIIATPAMECFMTRRWVLLFVAALVMQSCRAAAGLRGYASEDEMVEFIDNTATFKGKELAFWMSLDGDPGELLKDKVGSLAAFHAFPKSAHLKMHVSIPKTMEVPNAGYSDSLIVKFRCNEGSMTDGNVALSITRP